MYPSLLWNTIAFLVSIRVCALQYHSPHTEGADSSTNKAVLLEQVLLSRDFLLSEQEVHSSTTPGCTPQQHSPTAKPNHRGTEQEQRVGGDTQRSRSRADRNLPGGSHLPAMVSHYGDDECHQITVQRPHSEAWMLTM